MVNPEIIKQLESVWKLRPGLRFGQLLHDVIKSYHNNHTSVCGIENDLFQWEEAQWLKAIEKYRQKHLCLKD